MRMNIKRIDKAIDYYDRLIDETERNKLKQKVSLVVNIGITLLLSSCTYVTTNNVIDDNFISLSKPILFTILTVISVGSIYGNFKSTIEMNDDIRKYKKIKRLLISGDERRYRAFLESEYPGLYDNIVEIHNDKYNRQNYMNCNRGVRYSGR